MELLIAGAILVGAVLAVVLVLWLRRGRDGTRDATPEELPTD